MLLLTVSSSERWLQTQLCVVLLAGLLLYELHCTLMELRQRYCQDLDNKNSSEAALEVSRRYRQQAECKPGRETIPFVSNDRTLKKTPATTSDVI
jgi:hypothetical protein